MPYLEKEDVVMTKRLQVCHTALIPHAFELVTFSEEGTLSRRKIKQNLFTFSLGFDYNLKGRDSQQAKFNVLL